jgi:hypothetical protein
MVGVYPICGKRVLVEGAMDRNALIESFVNDWGFRDAGLDEVFRRAVEDFVAEICPQPTKLLPIIDPERKSTVRRMMGGFVTNTGHDA